MPSGLKLEWAMSRVSENWDACGKESPLALGVAVILESTLESMSKREASCLHTPPTALNLSDLDQYQE